MFAFILWIVVVGLLVLALYFEKKSEKAAAKAFDCYEQQIEALSREVELLKEAAHWDRIQDTDKMIWYAEPMEFSSKEAQEEYWAMRNESRENGTSNVLTIAYGVCGILQNMINNSEIPCFFKDDYIVDMMRRVEEWKGADFGHEKHVMALGWIIENWKFADSILIAKWFDKDRLVKYRYQV